MSADSIEALEQDRSARGDHRAADAERVAAAHLDVAISDIFLPQAGRLDERTRWAVLRLAETRVRSIEQQVAGDAARGLAAVGQAEAAAMLESNRAMAWPRLVDAALMRDADLIGELIAQTRVDLIDETLATLRYADSRPTLLSRLIGGDDAAVRVAALDLLQADSRRHPMAGDRYADLPVPMATQLTWWIAAALRERLGRVTGPEGDLALCEAAQRCIAGFRDEQRVDSAAARLAEALAATDEPIADLLLDAVESARLGLFIALLARALSIDAVAARALTLEPRTHGLWLALRGIGLPRPALARIGFLLCEADRERDLDAFVDVLDATAALAPEAARRQIGALTLPHAFRVAVRALAATDRS